jgi:glycosyltransferase involved in cell wall biosynthesis
MINFRGELIRTLVGAGHAVTAMTGPATNEERSAIEAFGANFRPFPIQRNGLNPLRDLRALYALRKAFRDLQPAIVVAYTIKPIIWGGIALRGLKNVRFFALITGLGFAFQGGSVARRMLTHLVTNLYRTALRRAQCVIFQNRDDKALFAAGGIVNPASCGLVNGSGVDLDRFAAVPVPFDGAVFLTVARLLGAKGLREFAAAAREVKTRYPHAEFRLLGPPDPSPDGIPLREVQEWHDNGWIRYLGAADDVRPFLASCSVFVFPSYHEGMPRAVLEALAVGRPILTTDVPGCRETVIEEENGRLVPKADAAALANRVVWFIENREAWERMGARSRMLAEERFDVRCVNREIMRLMNLN